jgi:hypothetical protein
MTPVYESRIRAYRRRVLVRSWEYRQRHHAHGTWFRLRRALADASAAFVISPEDARGLAAEGLPVLPVGTELAPPKLIVVVPAARIAGIRSARPIAVRLSADLLSAECLALTLFDTTRTVRRGLEWPSG